MVSFLASFHYQSLVPILSDLKTVTESYVKIGISTAKIVVPFPITNVYRNTLHSACSAASLRMPNSALDPVSIFAARAHDISNIQCQDSCEEFITENDPQQLVLTIKHS